MSEIKIHKHLKHENIVNFEHFFEDSENVYILLELCENQTLNELLRRRKRLTEFEIKCYMIQILNALQYAHLNQIIHRDLKLSNLFLSKKMEIKLGDFGLATKISFSGERKKTVCGTPNYIAPEILDSKNGHSYEVDIWSLGVLLYTLLIGKPPFETSDVKNTYRKIKANNYSFPESAIISKEVRNLIESLLVTDPSQRLTLRQIYEHDFLNNKENIPKNLPSSTLACPPSVSYLKKIMPNKDYSIEINNKNRLEVEKTEPLIAICENKNSGKQDFRLTERRASENPNVMFGQKIDFLKTISNKMIPSGSKIIHPKFSKENLEGKEIFIEENLEKKTKKEEIKNNKGNFEVNSKRSEVYIDEFLDYSLKYGLGFE